MGLNIIKYPLLFLFFFISYNVFSKEYRPLIKEVPSWVSPNRIEKILKLEKKIKSQGGLKKLRFETQVRLLPKGRELSFNRNTIKIIGTRGLSNYSKLEFKFDPNVSKLILHSIKVYRKGKIINLLKNSKFRKSQIEPELDKSLIYGNVVVYSFLKGLKIGDVLEYSFTWSRTRFFKEVQGSFQFNWSFPVGFIYYRIINDSGHDIVTKNHNNSPHPQLKKGGREYIWIKKNILSLDVEDKLPKLFYPYSWVEFSSKNSWKDVSQIFLPIMNKRRPFSKKLHNFVMKIKNSSLSLKQKINKVTRFVQDEIRYVGVEIGDRGYIPKDPNIVYEDGLGDCKDKSKLLVAILRKLGIKSSIALVNTESDIKTTLPGPYAFNHAIVNYIFDGINYWIDPTISIQRGKFGEIHIPHYKNALVLNKKTKDIIKINSHSQRAYGFDISINEHLVSKSVREPVDYIIEKTYKNQEANKIRRWVIDKGIDKVEKQFFNSALKNYPKLKKIRNIQMFDDQKNNIFKFIEHYEISHFWPLTGGHWKASFNIFSTFQDYLILPHNQKRKMPLKIGERTSLKHRFELRLHKKHDFVVNQVDFTHEVFDFSVGQDYSGNTFIFDATLKMNKDIVDPQEINSYIKKVNSIRGELFRYIKIKNEDSLFSTFKKIFKN